MPKKVSLLLSAIFAIGACILMAQNGQAQMSNYWPGTGRQNAENECARAVSLLEMGQIDNALAAIAKGTRDDATDPWPPQLQGSALMIQGRYPEALDSLQRAYAMQPTNEIILTTGLVYYLQHDYDAALNAYQKILQTNPKLCNIYANIGMAYFRKGDLQKAKEYFSRLVVCNPNSELGYFGLALTNYEEGNFQQAIEEAQRAESIESYPPAVFLLAQLDYLSGNRSRANKEANKDTTWAYKHWKKRSMIELGFPKQHDFRFDPYLVEQFDNAYFLLARMEPRPFFKREFCSWGHLDAALKHAESAMSVVVPPGEQPGPQPAGDWWAEQQVGLLRLSQGDYSGAAEALSRSLAHCPECRATTLHLAEAYNGDGKSEMASGMVQDFRKTQPAQDVAQHFKTMSKVDPALMYESQGSKHVEPPPSPPVIYETQETKHVERLEQQPIAQPRFDPAKDF
jgi:tetratricopeptide (TPR) repeat protein